MSLAILRSYLPELLAPRPDEILASWEEAASSAGFAKSLTKALAGLEDSPELEFPAGDPAECLADLLRLLLAQPGVQERLADGPLCLAQTEPGELILVEARGGRIGITWLGDRTEGAGRGNRRPFPLSLGRSVAVGLALVMIVLIFVFGMGRRPAAAPDMRPDRASLQVAFRGEDGLVQVGKVMTILIDASSPSGVSRVLWSDSNGNSGSATLSFPSPGGSPPDSARTSIQWMPAAEGETTLSFQLKDGQGQTAAVREIEVQVYP